MAHGAGLKRPRRAPRKPPPAPTRHDPVEIAMEAAASGRAPQGPALDLLVEQRRLVRWETASARMGAVLKALGIAAVLTAPLALGVMGWQANRAKGVVIESFSVPPDFAANGLTGEVVASQVQDKLTEMQRRTISARAGDTYANDWGHDIKVEIPQTGVSVGELQRYLRLWLGRETRVSGEVFRTAQGLRLAIRANGEAVEAVSGPEADLDGLLQRGALALYRRTQPYRWAIFVSGLNNAVGDVALSPEARPVAEELARTGPATDRAWAYNLLQGEPATIREANAILRAGLRIDPDTAILYHSLALNEALLGHDEAYLGLRKRLLEVVRGSDGGGLTRDAVEFYLHYSRSVIAGAAGDHLTALTEADAALLNPNPYSGWSGRLQAARALARLHRITEARAVLAAGDARLDRYPGYAPLIAAEIGRMAEDWPEAYRHLAADDAAIQRPPPSHHSPRRLLEQAPALVWAPMADTLANQGRVEDARALVANLPADCHPCLIARGQVAYLAGRPEEGDRWFAEALRQAPSFVNAPTAWARSRLQRGDYAGAIEAAKTAHQIGPRYADPLEIWGEAALAQGDARGAVVKFVEAAKLAPRWGGLHLKWGDALAAEGKMDEARAEWRAAAGMDLTASENARVQALIRGAASS